MDFTGSRGKGGTWAHWKGIPGLEQIGLDVGLLVGPFKIERGIKDVMQVFGSVNLIDGGAADNEWEQRTRNKG